MLATLINAGFARLRETRPAQALDCFKEALQEDPECAEALIGSTSALLQLNRPRQALAFCERALRLQPGLAEVHANAAAVYLALKRPKEALAPAEEAIRLRPDLFQAHFNRAEALRALQRHEQALEAYDRTISLRPDFVPAHCARGQACRELGDSQAARESYRRALRFQPDNPAARMGLAFSALPVVPGPSDDVDRCRQTFDAELSELDAWLATHESLSEWAVSSITPPFYLAYHERDNKDLLTRCGSLCTGLMERWAVRRKLPGEPLLTENDGRIHLGIVTAHVREHSVFRALVKGWLERLDRSGVRISVFDLGVARDDVPDLVRKYADLVECADRSLLECVQTIRSRNVDVLLYPEIGMDPMTLQLASLRLARRQIAAWGHPETSGLPTMDYYLSAEAFEPPGAQRYYSEKLVALPNLGCYYEPLGLAGTPPDLTALGIAPDAPVLLCAGTPYKYAPEHDGVLVAIARALPRCQLVFFEARPRSLSARLLARLHARFRAAGLDPDRCLVLVPWLSPEAFFGLMRRADALLDTLGFSGFNTVMQAIECELPVVAYEGRFMRGRFGSGVMRRLGLDELVATDPEDFVQNTVRLIRDAEFRDAVRARLRVGQVSLYRDLSTVDALTAFITSSSPMSVRRDNS